MSVEDQNLLRNCLDATKSPSKEGLFFRRAASFQIDQQDILHLAHSSTIAQTIEKKFLAQLDKLLKKYAEQTAKAVRDGRAVNTIVKVDFLKLYVDHYFSTAFSASHSQALSPIIFSFASPQKAARTVAAKLRDEYNLWKRSGIVDPEIRQYVAEIEAKYRKKIRDVVRKHIPQMNLGREEVEAAARAIQKSLEVGPGQAKTTLITETTRYYTETKRQIYDQVPSISHYLYVIIRDARTTKWCKTRGGIVYQKGSAYLEKETPPIHWCCRADILPLSPFNPAHKKLINNPSLRRENRTPEPLPPGWR